MRKRLKNYCISKDISYQWYGNGTQETWLHDLFRSNAISVFYPSMDCTSFSPERLDYGGPFLHLFNEFLHSATVSDLLVTSVTWISQNIKFLSHTRFRSATVTEPNVIVFGSRPGLGEQPLFYERSNPFGEPIKFPFVLLVGWDNQSVLQPGYCQHDGVLVLCRAGKRKYNLLQTHDRLWGPGSVVCSVV
jgi:hypothetical protein